MLAEHVKIQLYGDNAAPTMAEPSIVLKIYDKDDEVATVSYLIGKLSSSSPFLFCFYSHCKIFNTIHVINNTLIIH